MLCSSSARHPLATLAVASAIILAGCSEKSLVAPQKPVAVNRASSGLFATSIGDYTWVDVNKNGIQDAGDLPLPNVTVNLFAGSTCSGAPIQTMTSDPVTGYYLFYVDPGTYSVQAVTPAGYAPTTPNVGTDRELDSNPSCSSVTLADGEFDNSFDYGYVVRPVVAEGCTPGYWKNHSRWPSPYVQSTQFSSVFANAFPGKTLQQVLSAGGGGLTALGRQTVSALLNAGAIGGPNFPLTQAQVISQFNAAYAAKVYDPTKNYFESLTDSYAGIVCPLN